MTIGIIGAMQEEISLLKDSMQNKKEIKIANRSFYEGEIAGIKAVIVLAKIGKVAASITTTLLIEKFNVEAIVFTGVAGAIDSNLNIGDVVIATNLVQHDLDASPIFPKYEIPLLKTKDINTAQKHTNILSAAAKFYITEKLPTEMPKSTLSAFHIDSPKVIHGTIVSGDQFVKDLDTVKRIKQDINNVKCVEMEGAAVAQVCYEFGKPFSIIRVISDKADHSASIDFLKFLEIASHYSRGIINEFLPNLNQALTHKTTSSCTH